MDDPIYVNAKTDVAAKHTIMYVPMTTVDLIQRLIPQSLKRWLGLPKTLSTACFYSKSA